MIRIFKGTSPNVTEIVSSSQRIIPFKSISIEDTRDSSRFTFQHITRDWTIERLQPGNPIEVRDYHSGGDLQDDAGDLYTLEWAGVIVSLSLTGLGTDVFTQECECEGWQKWLNRRLVKKKYTKGQNSGDIFRDVLARFTEYLVVRSEGSGLILQEFNPANIDDANAKAYYVASTSSGSYMAHPSGGFRIQFPMWFTIGLIANGITNMPELDYDFIPVGDVFRDICEKTGYVWYVTPERAIYLDKPEASWNNSPLPKNILDADFGMDNYSINNYYDLTITETVGQIKNWIIGVGAKYPADYEIIRTIASAVGLTFPWGTEAFSRNNDNTLTDWFTFQVVDNATGEVKRTLTSIKKDKIDSVVGDGKGDNTTIYADLDKMLARLPDNFGLAAGESLRITMVPAVSHPDPLPWAIGLNEMKAREGATSGKYEYRMSLEGLWTEDGESASAAMGQVADKYGEPAASGQFKSRLRGWRAGQMFRLRSNRYRMSSARTQFDRECYVTEVTKKILSPATSTEDNVIESDIKFGVKPIAGVSYM